MENNGTWPVAQWKFINDNWYYSNNSCAMVHDQWIGNYYVRYNGACARNGWLKWGDTWYHFNGNADIDVTQQYAPTLISEPEYYISPMKIGDMNTPSERIEAMIFRAYDYSGSIWKACHTSTSCKT